jgi:hypothetical protein
MCFAASGFSFLCSGMSAAYPEQSVIYFASPTKLEMHHG